MCFYIATLITIKFLPSLLVNSMLSVPVVLLCVCVCMYVRVRLGGLSKGRVFWISLSDGVGRADHTAGSHRLQKHSLRVSPNIMSFLLKARGVLACFTCLKQKQHKAALRSIVSVFLVHSDESEIRKELPCVVVWKKHFIFVCLVNFKRKVKFVFAGLFLSCNNAPMQYIFRNCWKACLFPV